MAKRAPPTAPTISPTRVRLGIALFVLWWLPVYLAVPAVVELFGEANNAHARRLIAIGIVTLQTIAGLAGLYLLGKELAVKLRTVRLRRMPVIVWRIVKSGQTTIDPQDLKQPKK